MELLKDMVWDLGLTLYVSELYRKSRSMLLKFAYDTKFGGILNIKEGQSSLQRELDDWSLEY